MNESRKNEREKTGLVGIKVKEKEQNDDAVELKQLASVSARSWANGKRPRHQKIHANYANVTIPQIKS